MILTAIWQTPLPGTATDLESTDIAGTKFRGFSTPLPSQLQPAFDVRNLLIGNRIELVKVQFTAYEHYTNSSGHNQFYPIHKPVLAGLNVFINSRSLLPNMYGIVPTYTPDIPVPDMPEPTPLVDYVIRAQSPFLWENICFESETINDIGITAMATVDNTVYYPVVAQVDFRILR